MSSSNDHASGRHGKGRGETAGPQAPPAAHGCVATSPVTIALETGSGLAARIQQLCVDLDYGAAEVLDLVTPTTRELLRCWFGQRAMEQRGTLNFSAAQREAILQLVVAHEVLLTKHLLEVHAQLASAPPRAGYPRYRLGLPAVGCDVFVLAALLVWQLANRQANQDAVALRGPSEKWPEDDARFAPRLLVAAPDAATAALLFDALAGPQDRLGQRAFHVSLFVRAASLLLPARLRAPLLKRLNGRVRAAGQPPAATLEEALGPGAGLVAVAAPCEATAPALQLQVPLAVAARGLMVFQMVPPDRPPAQPGPWQAELQRLAQGRQSQFAQVDLVWQAPWLLAASGPASGPAPDPTSGPGPEPAPRLSENHPTPA